MHLHYKMLVLYLVLAACIITTIVAVIRGEQPPAPIYGLLGVVGVLVLFTFTDHDHDHAPGSG